jgi:SulP family sulfate permease
VIYYEIAGPLFFGAAHRATRALHQVGRDAKAVVLDISSVPAIDATGVVNLESAIARLHKDRVLVVIAGMKAQPASVLARAGVVDVPGKLVLAADLDHALEAAIAHAGSAGTGAR